MIVEDRDRVSEFPDPVEVPSRKKHVLFCGALPAPTSKLLNGPRSEYDRPLKLQELACVKFENALIPESEGSMAGEHHGQKRILCAFALQVPN